MMITRKVCCMCTSIGSPVVLSFPKCFDDDQWVFSKLCSSSPSCLAVSGNWDASLKWRSRSVKGVDDDRANLNNSQEGRQWLDLGLGAEKEAKHGVVQKDYLVLPKVFTRELVPRS